MAVTATNVVGSRYWPERLPATNIFSAAALGLITPAPLDLRRFGERIVSVQDVAIGATANLQLEFTYDNSSLILPAAGMPDLANATQERAGMYFDLVAIDNLVYNVRAVTLPVTDVPGYHVVEIQRPNIAQKLLRGFGLSPEEEAIAQRTGVRALLQQGLVPISTDFILEREVVRIQEFTTTDDITAGDIPNEPAQAATFRTLPADPGEFIVLTGIAATPNTPADNVRIRVKRDDQTDYVEVQPYAIAGSAFNPMDRTLRCWVPAVRELEFSIIQAQAGAAGQTSVRLNFVRAVLSDLWRVRWGLATRDQVDPQLYDDVIAGIR